MPRKSHPAAAVVQPPEPELTPTIARAQARMLLMQQRAQKLYLTDPAAFCRDLVQTKDQIDGQIKRFAFQDYHQVVFDRLLRHKLLLIAKSRRMMLTWACVTFGYWIARTQPHALIGFFARKEGKTKEEGSAELCERFKLIHEHLLPALPPMELIEDNFCYKKLANGSVCVGIGQGSDQARQMTFTYVLADEFAHWEWAGPTWTAMKPTADGGGRITLLSSAGPGFMASLMFDHAL